MMALADERSVTGQPGVNYYLNSTTREDVDRAVFAEVAVDFADAGP
ncbi:MAG: hypothetical protein IPJ97_07415 [Proteobacteria bacterium]|nr:hypothetical protein [Pseudomonadota bacterium]